MAPSSGHLLVPKVIRVVKFGYSQAAKIIRSKLPQSTQSTSSTALQPIRISAENRPIRPLAYLKQFRSQSTCWFSTTATRTFTSSAKPNSGARYDRSIFPISRISRAISQRGGAPFASTLRPNLTGGALPRSAGGYSLGGAGKGARNFSHIPGCQAQVVQNVSAGVRAFFIGGGKARFDGIDHVTGGKRFRSVSPTEDAVYKKWETPSARGTNLNFKLSPTVTALCPSFSSQTHLTSLNDPKLLDNLSIDFARAIKDLSTLLADLRRLSCFGDLPISLTTTTSGPILSIRFPGCDGDLVSRLCDEVGVRRGVIVEDETWNEKDNKDVQMALLFPFAPSPSHSVASDDDDAACYFEFDKKQGVQREHVDWRHMLSPSTCPESLRDNVSFEELAMATSPNLVSKSPSGNGSLREIDYDSDDPYCHDLSPFRAPSHITPAASGTGDYEGLEGIYKFLQVCEDSRRRI